MNLLGGNNVKLKSGSSISVSENCKTSDLSAEKSKTAVLMPISRLVLPLLIKEPSLTLPDRELEQLPQIQYHIYPLALAGSHSTMLRLVAR